MAQAISLGVQFVNDFLRGGPYIRMVLLALYAVCAPTIDQRVEANFYEEHVPGIVGMGWDGTGWIQLVS